MAVEDSWDDTLPATAPYPYSQPSSQNIRPSQLSSTPRSSKQILSAIPLASTPSLKRTLSATPPSSTPPLQRKLSATPPSSTPPLQYTLSVTPPSCTPPTPRMKDKPANMKKQSLHMGGSDSVVLLWGCMVQKESSQPVTHRMLDGTHGGNFYVPPHLEAEFLERYAGDCTKNENSYRESGFQTNKETVMCISEQRTDIFRMHFDIDGIYLSDDDRFIFLQALQTFISLFYPASKALPVMCITDTKTSDERFPLYAKHNSTNLHIYLPYVYVDSEKAMTIACGCTSKLQQLLPTFEWNKIIDKQIYTTNGLRMLGAQKCDDCPTCNKRITKGCLECHGIGRINQRRIYDLVAVMDSERQYNEELLQMYSRTFLDKLKVCSTRCIDGQIETPDFMPYPGCPRSDYSFMNEKVTKKAASKYTEILTSSIKFKACLDAIQAFAPCYRTTQIQQIKYVNGAYLVKVQGDSASKCFNLSPSYNGGSHHHTTIYFVITQRGIVQKCFSKKDQLHLNGLCKNYASSLKILNHYTMITLFPEALNVAHQNEQKRDWRTIMRLKNFIERDGVPEPKRRKKRKNSRRKIEIDR